MTDLAAYLDEYISLQRWSRQEAADRAGLGKTTITNIINRRQQPTKESLVKIASGWGISLDHLLDLAGLPRASSTAAEQATAGLTEAQLRFLAALTPEQRRRLVDAGRGLLGDDTRP